MATRSSDTSPRSQLPHFPNRPNKILPGRNARRARGAHPRTAPAQSPGKSYPSGTASRSMENTPPRNLIFDFGAASDKKAKQTLADLHGSVNDADDLPTPDQLPACTKIVATEQPAAGADPVKRRLHMRPSSASSNLIVDNDDHEHDEDMSLADLTLRKQKQQQRGNEPSSTAVMDTCTESVSKITFTFSDCPSAAASNDQATATIKPEPMDDSDDYTSHSLPVKRRLEDTSAGTEQNPIVIDDSDNVDNEAASVEPAVKRAKLQPRPKTKRTARHTPQSASGHCRIGSPHPHKPRQDKSPLRAPSSASEASVASSRARDAIPSSSAHVSTRDGTAGDTPSRLLCHAIQNINEDSEVIARQIDSLPARHVFADPSDLELYQSTQSAAHQLKDGKVVLAFVGERGQGKSFLANHLLCHDMGGSRPLPSGPGLEGVTKAPLVAVCEPFATSFTLTGLVRRQSPQTRQMEMSRLDNRVIVPKEDPLSAKPWAVRVYTAIQDMTSRFPANSPPVIEIRGPFDHGYERLVVVDIPGFGDDKDIDLALLTNKALGLADATVALAVVAARGGSRDTFRPVLERVVQQNMSSSIAVVYNAATRTVLKQVRENADATRSWADQSEIDQATAASKACQADMRSHLQAAFDAVLKTRKTLAEKHKIAADAGRLINSGLLLEFPDFSAGPPGEKFDTLVRSTLHEQLIGCVRRTFQHATHENLVRLRCSLLALLQRVTTKFLRRHSLPEITLAVDEFFESACTAMDAASKDLDKLCGDNATEYVSLVLEQLKQVILRGRCHGPADGVIISKILSLIDQHSSSPSEELLQDSSAVLEADSSCSAADTILRRVKAIVLQYVEDLAFDEQTIEERNKTADELVAKANTVVGKINHHLGSMPDDLDSVLSCLQQMFLHSSEDLRLPSAQATRACLENMAASDIIRSDVDSESPSAVEQGAASLSTSQERVGEACAATNGLATIHMQRGQRRKWAFRVPEQVRHAIKQLLAARPGDSLLSAHGTQAIYPMQMACYGRCHRTARPGKVRAGQEPCLPELRNLFGIDTDVMPAGDGNDGDSDPGHGSAASAASSSEPRRDSTEFMLFLWCAERQADRLSQHVLQQVPRECDRRRIVLVCTPDQTDLRRLLSKHVVNLMLRMNVPQFWQLPHNLSGLLGLKRRSDHSLSSSLVAALADTEKAMESKTAAQYEQCMKNVREKDGCFLRLVQLLAERPQSAPLLQLLVNRKDTSTFDDLEAALVSNFVAAEGATELRDLLCEMFEPALQWMRVLGAHLVGKRSLENHRNAVQRALVVSKSLPSMKQLPPTLMRTNAVHIAAAGLGEPTTTGQGEQYSQSCDQFLFDELKELLSAVPANATESSEPLDEEKLKDLRPIWLKNGCKGFIAQ